jgi:hypothetical protein
MITPFAGLFDLGTTHSFDSLSAGSVYVDLYYAIGFQVGIGGGAQARFQDNGVCPNPTYTDSTYNFTAYNIQPLHSCNHTLDLTLLNTPGVNPYGTNSLIMQ